MSAHVYSGWTYEHPIEDAPIGQIAQCVKAHKYGLPSVFSTLCAGDAIVMVMGLFLAASEGEVLTRDRIVLFLSLDGDSPRHKQLRPIITEVMVKVLEKLDLFDKEFHKP